MTPEERAKLPFPRVEYFKYAQKGEGWYYEIRRLTTYSLWQGPYPTRELAERALNELLDPPPNPSLN